MNKYHQILEQILSKGKNQDNNKGSIKYCNYSAFKLAILLKASNTF
jgi:hypothetical protein